MKKSVYPLAASILLILACNKPQQQVISIPVASVTVTPASCELTVGDTKTLTAVVSPENATNKVLTWSSSDGQVATVSVSGVVSALKAGTVTITANAGGKEGRCEITVVPATVIEKSVSLNLASKNLFPQERVKLIATVQPENAGENPVAWSTSNPAFATVEDGLVTAVAEGTATITATIPGGKPATCKITVEKVTVPEGTVDLGVMAEEPDGSRSRVFWATCNVGAKQPQEYGDYFAWGETQTKSSYSGGDNYKWSGGYPSEKAELAPEDDAAYVVLGENWRIPSKAQIEALRTCQWTFGSMEGTNGFYFYSPDAASSIFLPATGYKDRAYTLGTGDTANYYSRSWYSDNHTSCYYLGINTGGPISHKEQADTRIGMTIRPVWNR